MPDESEDWGAAFAPDAGGPPDPPATDQSLPGASQRTPGARISADDEVPKPANWHQEPPAKWEKPARSVGAIMAAPDDPALKADLDRLNKLAEEAKAFRARWEDWAKLQRDTMRCCPVHRDVMLPRDDDASVRESYKLTAKASAPVAERGVFVLMFKPCIECQATEATAEAGHWMKSRGVPDLYLTARFPDFRVESPDDAAALKAAKEFVDTRRGFFVMTGTAGDGKTYLAAAIMRSFHAQGFTDCYFVRHTELVVLLRRGYGDKEATKVIERCQRASLIVLDDILPEELGGQEKRIMFNIFDHRYGDRLATIITWNQSYEALLQFLGERIASRFQQALFRRCHFSGPSARTKEQGTYFK